MKKRSLLFLAIILLFPSLGLSATYYVSNAGDDSNAGTQGAPWATISKVNMTGLAPGDQVLFQRGGIFRDTLQPTISGVEGKPITYGAYGTGNRPLIDATGLYYGIVFSGLSYLSFADLEVRGSLTDGFATMGDGTGKGCNNIIVQRCRFAKNAKAGMNISDWRGYPMTNRNWTIEDNDISDNPGMGMLASSLANSLIKRNIASRNCQDGTCGEMCNWCAGIRITNVGSIGNVVESNQTSGNTGGAGIWIDFNGSGEVVRYNESDKNDVGYYFEITSGVIAYGNVGWNNTLAGCYIGGRQGTPPENGPAIGNLFYNNTLYYNGQFGLIVQDDDGIAGNCHDNVIVNNIVVGTTNGPNLRVGGGAETEKNIIDHNAFGSESANMFEIGWGAYRSTYASLEQWYGKSTNPIKSTPTFTNAASRDLSLKPGSPGIDAGLDLGVPYNMGLSATSVWPSGVVLTGRGAAWDIGAYERTDTVLLGPPANLRLIF
jgi:hypothetical protein